MISFLEQQGVSKALIRDLENFRRKHPSDDRQKERIPHIRSWYYGKEVWEMAICALLEGYHVLLSGPKATGKNVLADNLAYAFGRPAWTISLHVNTDSASLIGTDTFRNNQVEFRNGPVSECALQGGFGIFDEINMAKNEAMAVLYSALDHRRILDVPGYDKITLHNATRFIATMNHGYVGTRELNEALVSRFLVIEMPLLTERNLKQILHAEFPEMNEDGLHRFSTLFLDLQLKSIHSELSTKSVDLRGLIGALHCIERGLSVRASLAMGLINKSMDPFEQELVNEVITLNISSDAGRSTLFGRNG